MGVKQKWKLVTKFDVTKYKCGLVAGELVRLRKTLRCKDHQGNLTGDRYNRGGIWRVYRGSKQDPGVVFLRQPNGKKHTWDDDPEIFEWFEREPRIRSNAGKRLKSTKAGRRII